MRAGQPFAVASDGIVIQTSASTPIVPIAAPANAVPTGQRLAVAAEAVHDDADAEAERLPERRDEHEEQHRDRHPVVGAGAAERRDDAGDVAHADDEARARRRPTRTRARRSRGASRRRRRRAPPR